MVKMPILASLEDHRLDWDDVAGRVVVTRKPTLRVAWRPTPDAGVWLPEILTVLQEAMRRWAARRRGTR